MSPEAQRIAIAEATGDWKNCRVIKGQHGDWDEVVGFGTFEDGSLAESEDPVPLYDLHFDAVIPAVLQLIGGDVGQDLQARHRIQIFIRELMKLTSGRWAPDWPDCESYGRFAVIHLMLNLSPDKITEALLRTLNLWTE